jgi:small subunit ribosomal protein S16
MKKMGRKHRPFFRICAVDRRAPRDGRVIEELGYYDPMCKEKDARAVLKAERVDYWLGVGAQPSDKCAVLIKKYGTGGTHLDEQQQAFSRLSIKPQAPEAVAIPLPSEEAAPAAEQVAAEAPAEPAVEEAAAAAPAETTEAPAVEVAEAPAAEVEVADGDAPKAEAGGEEKSE